MQPTLLWQTLPAACGCRSIITEKNDRRLRKTDAMEPD